MIKDLKFAIAAAQEAGVEPTIAEVAVKMFERAAEDPVTTVS
jgi:3-hydroxyisobutyrate dehydrogenase-like beta-hydroxyacid dehydrogenase